jgi:oxygen-dependent protoporphyrinogen oxidase
MSILRFAQRHIGHEAADVLVGSMVSGIFVGDASRLSIRCCFPKMHEMETQYCSLVRAMLAKRREARSGSGVGMPAGRLTSFVGGMEDLVRAAAASLGPIVRTNRRVIGVQPGRGASRRAFSIACDGPRVEADAVVLAGPAHESADLVRAFAPEAARLLAAIETAPLAVVCLGYDAAALNAERGPLNGFGFLVPRGERPRILGALWESSIYDGRAPAGRVLLRVMIGGALDPHAVDLDEAGLLAVVRGDLELTMGLRRSAEFVHVVRHRRGIPQYTIRHGTRVAGIERALAGQPGLFLAGNSYRGVSVSACIEDAGRVAKDVAAHLAVVDRQGNYAVAR